MIPNAAAILGGGTNVLAIHGLNSDPRSTDMLFVAEIKTNDYDYEQAIGKVVDLDSFYKFWAIEGLVNSRGPWIGVEEEVKKIESHADHGFCCCAYGKQEFDGVGDAATVSADVAVSCVLAVYVIASLTGLLTI